VLAFGHTDFRNDVPSVTVPTLIIHGDADKIVPAEVSAERMRSLLPHAEYKLYEGAPHGLFYTHREQLNADLIAFCTAGASETTSSQSVPQYFNRI
jgi:pimeloyl-ACP methyl ester carboxylesterase